MSLVKRNNNVWFQEFIDDIFKPDWLGGIQNDNHFVPSVNITNSEDHFKLELAVPGRKKEDFNIEVNENILTVSSEQKSNNKKEVEERYTRKEFNIASFKRVFTLPEIVDEDKIEATYLQGVLEVTLPKKEEALPKAKRMIAIS